MPTTFYLYVDDADALYRARGRRGRHAAHAAGRPVVRRSRRERVGPDGDPVVHCPAGVAGLSEVTGAGRGPAPHHQRARVRYGIEATFLRGFGIVTRTSLTFE